MLIKEYRIILPLSVEEFRIGLLYMLLKKSRTDSQGEGNGIEILKNEPYSGEEGTGQYTYKILHVGSHVPKFFKDLAPEDAFKLQEESWNLYPYVHTISTTPFTNKYRLDLQSKFIQDKGESENVFNLPPAELKARQIVYIDIANTTGVENVTPEEDPKFFKSQKTGRGPLTPNWMDSTDGDTPVMCCYKLAKVEFKYWGLQTRVERLIHEMGVQRTFAMAHRQVWCWQDEWIDLTLPDIRRLEAETAEYLQKVMQGELEAIPAIKVPSPVSNEEKGLTGSVDSVHISKPKPPLLSRRSLSQSFFLECLDESDDEFHDAVDVEGFELVAGEDDEVRLRPHRMFNSPSFEMSNEVVNEESTVRTDDHWSTKSVYWDTIPSLSELASHPDETTSPLQKGHTSLMLVVHGGSYLDVGADTNVKQWDFQIFTSKLDELRQKHFYHTQHKVQTRLIPCPYICTRALACMGVLKSCPEFSQNSLGMGLSFNPNLNSTLVEDKLDNFALGALPLLVRSDKRYVEYLTEIINTLNATYDEFVSTTEDFSGQVSMVADCMGSLVTYDILSQFSSSTPPLKFTPHQFFMLGSPVGMILTQEKLSNTGAEDRLTRPSCEHLYNIYYEGDPLSFRIEPLLDLQTRFLASFRIYSYNKLPLGDGSSHLLQDYVQEEEGGGKQERSNSFMDIIHTESEGGHISNKMSRVVAVSSYETLLERWWGTERVDYSVQSPYAIGGGSHNFTTSRIIYSRYWEANEILSFILRSSLSFLDHKQTPQVTPQKCLSVPGTSAAASEEKADFNRFRSASTDSANLKLAQRKRNNIKYLAMTPNFRGVDAMVLEGQPQVLQGRFIFGKLDIASLSREPVEVFYQDREKRWSLLDTINTDTHGILRCQVPPDKRFPVGVHCIHMLASGDTSTVLRLAVLPSNQSVDAVVFSIDGSFYMDFSVKGNKSKVRPGSVEIVEFWRNLGYLIVYVTARPDMQKNDIMRWFSKKKFPTALTYFNDGVTTEPQSHKMLFLRHLIQDLGVKICAAYGSAKEFQTYKDAGVRAECIYSLGKKSKQSGSHSVGEGFLTHVQELKTTPPPLAKTSVLLAHM